MHRKNRADGHIDVDIAAAVQRVEGYDIIGAGIIKVDDAGFFLAGHGREQAGISEIALAQLIGINVEVSLCLIMDIGAVGQSQHIRQAGPVSVRRDQLADRRYVSHHQDKLILVRMVLKLPEKILV